LVFKRSLPPPSFPRHFSLFERKLVQDPVLHLGRRLMGFVARHEFALFADEELGEIPLDDAAVLRQELPEGMRTAAVHFDFGEKVKGDAVGFLHVFLYFRIGARFLPFELVTWESKNTKTRFTSGVVAVQSL